MESKDGLDHAVSRRWMLGSVGVLATLIYLAIQTRQNTASIQASTRQAILDADQKFLFCVMDDPDLILLRFKPELTDADKIRLSAYWISFLRLHARWHVDHAVR